MTQTTPTPTLNAGMSLTTYGRGYFEGEGLFGQGTFDADGNFELDEFGGGFVEAVQALEAEEAGNE